MPANLPPQYYEAEDVYRQARTHYEKIEALEAMLAIMPHHKGTDKLRANLRTRLAKHATDAERQTIGKRKGPSYHIRQEGAGQVVLVGLPNSGKSQLLASLTSSSPRVADYLFTTLVPTPGMMPFENIQFQLVDTPAITYEEARPWFNNLLRSADLLLLVVDLAADPTEQLDALLNALSEFRVRALGKEEQQDAEDFRVQKRALVLANKSDVAGASEKLRRLTARYGDEFNIVAVSARDKLHLEQMKRRVFDSLDIVRVYTKTRGEEADLTDPVILRNGETVQDVAAEIHKDLRRGIKYANVWGSSKYDGQRVPRDYVPQDGDIVEVRI